MAWNIDEKDEGAIVMNGNAGGISPSPYEGISDMRNMNIISVPNEASVNFATSKISTASLTGTVTSADAGADTVTVTSATGLENGMAISFSATTVSGISTSTVYWIQSLSGNTFKLYSNIGWTTTVNITSDGTGTYATYNMAQPHYFATTLHNKNTPNSGINNNKQWVVDSLGQVWTNWNVTTSGMWTYSGNKVPTSTYTNGNGLVAYHTFNGGSPQSYLIVFHNSSIDYIQTNAATPSWAYQWNPTAGTIGAYAATPNPILNSPLDQKVSHEALVSINDNVVYYCDYNFLGSFFEKAGQVFLPSDITTYTPAKNALGLPINDNANCLAELGNLLLTGGQRNAIYPWDRQAHVVGLSINSGYNTPILIAENVISKMVTVNTNTYIFAGNRGRIYTTNGSQAQLYHKVPDHLSGTVEPYYTWGGACFAKNQLYFSFSVTDNALIAITTMGGLWAINLDTDSATQKAMRLTNQLSYGTYAGLASAVFNPVPTLITPSNPAGVGVLIGWDNGASGYGIDTTTSAPYAGSQAYVDYDLIPVGTFYRPNTPKSVEYKLSVPMVTGESVSIYYRKLFSNSYTLIFTSTNTTNGGSISEAHSADFENAQWVQLRAVTNSTASSPSYTRLLELRLRSTV